MGICLFSRRFSLHLISSGLFEWGYFRRIIIVKDTNFCKLYRNASTAFALDYSDSGSIIDLCSVNGLVGPGNKPHSFEGLPLFSNVVRVAKSLDWRVAGRIRFEKAVNEYGLPGSINAFRMIVHVFASAQMPSEVEALVRDIVNYYQTFDLDLFELLPTMLESCNHEATSVFVVDALIKAFATNLMLENAVDVFFHSKEIGIQPGIRSCNFLLKCLAERNGGKYLFTLFEGMEISGPPPNDYSYSILINFWCKVDMDKAKSLLWEMMAKGITPTFVTYSTLIRGLCRDGNVDIALEFIRDLMHSNQPINVYSYNPVMQAFCKNGKLDKAKSVFAEMKSHGILPDVHSYTILIDGYCKFGDTETGLNLIKEMQSDVVNLKPSLVTYTSLLQGMFKTKPMEDCVDMFRELENLGYKYDQFAYNVLISGFLMQRNVKSAHVKMIRNNLAPAATDYIYLIRAFRRLRSVDKAWQSFNGMKVSGVVPNALEGHVRKALEFLDEMRNRGIDPNIFSYSIIIDGLCKEGKPESALELLPLMLKSNIFPNVVVYSTLIHGFARQLKVEKALMLYTRMIKSGVTPNTHTYTILINTLFTKDKAREAYNMFTQMTLDGLNPDSICYTSVIDGLCKIGDLGKAYKVYREMKASGHLPSVVTYTCLIDAYSKQNRMDEASIFLEEMNRQNLCPDVVTYTVLVNGYLRQGKVEIVHHLFNKMRKEGLVPVNMMCQILGLRMGGNVEGR